ncbi:MAG: hypothetical protein CMI54_06200 [Parcubacteria group bacterium]|jgi:hypothetical protein|nr:hypothetical protein [Parcubacteria group bacterium]|tara:strand:+ start:1237 stop:1701 length:465 start_codon:yes stop_codon:yes gene_type:complete
MYFEPLKRMLNNIIRLDENALIKEILSDKKFQEFIIKLNTEGQLFEEGIDSLGVSLGDYSPATIEGTSSFEGKKDKGQRYDHITLKDTGDFYGSFKISLSNTSLNITADPKKDDSNLFDDFGKEIVGLTDKNLQIVINAIREKLIPKVRLKIAA